jgi:tripartite-type tricarboxylate transporter receptor subunit TctC
MFKMMTGVDMVHVPYRGGAPALTALLGGQVQAYFGAMSTTIAGIRANMRPLAVTTVARWGTLPDVPAMGEYVPGYDVSTWFGVGAPKSTPTEIITRLSKEIDAGLADPTIKQRLAELGGSPMPMTPAEFGRFIADETEKWAKVIRFANVTAS